MNTKSTYKNVGGGLSRSAFEDDGIPNSPFKSSRSAAFSLAIFGILLGSVFIVFGGVSAVSQAQRNATPVKAVQQIVSVAPPVVVQPTVKANAQKRYVNPARKAAKKRHAKSKLSHAS